MPQNTRAKFICALALIAVTLAVYWPAAHFSFVNYDDPDYVTMNTAIQRGVNVPMIKWAFTTDHASNWHPLTWISHTLDYSLYGTNADGHHVTNLLFHAANAVLLFFALCEFTGAVWRSALVAALFAWHPLHVESVAWVSERKDVLSGFFWLLTMLAYVKFVRASNIKDSKSKLFYCLALLCFALGLLSKPMIVTLPFVLLLLDFWPLNRTMDSEGTRSSWRRLVVEKVPFFILAAMDCAATFWAQKATHAVVEAATLPFAARLANALVSCMLYLWKTIWPADLALPYPYSHEWTFLQAAGAGLLLTLITGFTLWRLRPQPWLLVGWLWFLGTLVPVIGLVQVGIQFMADRYTYLPLIGIFIAAAWSIPERWAHWPRPGLILRAILVCVLFFSIAGTETQLQYWRNSVTLFRHTVQVTHDNILAEYNLGAALAESGDEDEAAIHYQKALAITPNRVEAQYNSQPQARFNLGLIYRKHKKWPECEAMFRGFVSEQPDVAAGHANWGTALVALGRTEEAMREFSVAIRPPSRARVLGLLDTAYAEAGKFPEAIAAVEKTRVAALAEGRQDLADAADKRLTAYRAAKN